MDAGCVGGVGGQWTLLGGLPNLVLRGSLFLGAAQRIGGRDTKGKYRVVEGSDPMKGGFLWSPMGEVSVSGGAMSTAPFSILI